MSRLYVYQKTEKLVRKYGTRDPFELLDAMHVQVRFYFDLHSTKGFSRYFLRQYFVGINGNLPKEEQRIVAAHELGHIVLHAEALRNSGILRSLIRLSTTSAAARSMRPICSRRISFCGTTT